MKSHKKIEYSIAIVIFTLFFSFFFYFSEEKLLIFLLEENSLPKYYIVKFVLFIKKTEYLKKQH